MAVPELPPQLANIAAGAKTLVYDLPGHHEWDGIACAFHSGQQMTRQDDQDVASPDVGFQPDCEACVRTVTATIEYMHARYADVMRSQQ